MKSMVTDCKIHRKESGFLFARAEERHGESVNNILASAFFHEPMGQVLGLSEQDWWDFVRYFIPECMNNGLSVIAVPEDRPDILAGAIVTRDFRSPLPEGFPGGLEGFAPILRALESIDEEYEAMRPGIPFGDTLDLWMLGVSHDAPYLHKGLSHLLIKVALEVAKKKGYRYAVGECTGHFSQHGAVDAGFKERARVVYKDFEFEGKRVFENMPEPHRTFGFYEMDLSRFPSSPS